MKLKTIISLTICGLLIGALITACTVPQQVITTNPDGSQSTNTIHAPDPKLASAGIVLTTAAPVIPPPYGWIAAMTGALITAGGTLVANHKNKAKANQWEDVATTIIQGVEAVTSEAGKVVKASIEERSKTDGNHDLVRDVVASETKDLNSPI